MKRSKYGVLTQLKELPHFVCCGAPRLASPRDLASKTSPLKPLPALLLETSPPKPRPRDLALETSSLRPLRRPLPATPSLGELSFVVARCVLASRCGLARFLQKVRFFRLFKSGSLGNRLLAAVLQWSIRKTAILIDSFGRRFTSFFVASQSTLFYRTFRARSSKTT